MEEKRQRWYTKKEACSALDLTVREFNRYISMGIFPRGITVADGRELRWTPEDIEVMHFIDRHNRRFRRSKRKPKPGSE